MEWKKVQSPAKSVKARNAELSKTILDTMHTISEVVGNTLGPGGMPVLIERQEYGLPGLVTKDGVTVFRSLGFDDPTAHAIMESARDAAVRTVSEAGDGTTTATILAEAIVRYTHRYISANPRVSPQRVVRKLEQTFKDYIEPTVRTLATQVDPSSKKGQKYLHAVATISANGDTALADAVMECYRIVGDVGNITIIEQNGPSHYEVERIEGFPVGIGYEESCMKFMGMFINDAGNQRCFLNKPRFILYHGHINEIQVLFALLDRLQTAWQNVPGAPNYDPGMPRIDSPNIVLVATGFSESVLGSLAMLMVNGQSINVVPLLVPKTAIMNSELHFLEDLAAVTGSTILNPLSADFASVGAQFEEIGIAESFEMYRFRATVVGHYDSDEVAMQAEAIQQQIENAESELDKRLLQERLGKITGGIAKLRVVGASNGELREKKDRAEDAVSAVKGAMKHGVLPGGGWTLCYLAHNLLKDPDPIVNQILVDALLEPVRRLFSNCGLTGPEYAVIAAEIEKSIVAKKCIVYDAMENKYVDAFKSGILDSVPAVLEAIRSSVSIASLLGSLGGVVVFRRDEQLEREEAKANNSFVRDANG